MVYICMYIQELINTGMLKGMHIVFCEKCFHYGTVVSPSGHPLKRPSGQNTSLVH